MTDRLQQIRDRADKASRSAHDGEARWTVGESWATGGEPMVLDTSGYPVAAVGQGNQATADAEFIAHARADVPWLLDALTASTEDAERRVEDVAAELRRALDSRDREIDRLRGEVLRGSVVRDALLRELRQHDPAYDAPAGNS